MSGSYTNSAWSVKRVVGERAARAHKAELDLILLVMF